MNNKEQLLNYIERTFSDEACGRILNRMRELTSVTHVLINSANWEEHEHPRASDGRFTRKGSGAPSHFTEKQEKQWVATGKGYNVSPKLHSKYKAEIRHLRETIAGKVNGDLVWDEKTGKRRRRTEEERNELRAELSHVQRKYAEDIREAKRKRRLSMESSARKRHMQKLAKEYYDLDEEIDWLEEAYADRDGDPSGPLKFPETAKGKRDKKKYESSIARRDEISEEIDWDLVEDED